MKTTCGDLLYSFVFQVLNYLWDFDIFYVAVTALSFIIAVSTTSPTVDSSVLVKCDTVEIPTADLCYRY